MTTPDCRTKPMLVLAGKKYVCIQRRSRRQRQLTAEAQGFYQRRGAGLLLLDTRQVPIAYVCNNRPSSPFLVTAHDVEGRVRFMFGLASYTAQALGIGIDAISEREAAESLIAQAGR